MKRHFILADVNVWLATVLEQHPHHGVVTQWWKAEVASSDYRVALCRVTQLGLLRLLTNEHVMGERKQTNTQAWEIQKQLLSQERIVFADEPKAVDKRLARLSRRTGSSSGFWTDAYLAAFAVAAEWPLATLDRGFKRFPDLSLSLLS